MSSDTFYFIPYFSPLKMPVRTPKLIQNLQIVGLKDASIYT